MIERDGWNARQGLSHSGAPISLKRPADGEAEQGAALIERINLAKLALLIAFRNVALFGKAARSATMGVCKFSKTRDGIVREVDAERRVHHRQQT